MRRRHSIVANLKLDDNFFSSSLCRVSGPSCPWLQVAFYLKSGHGFRSAWMTGESRGFLFFSCFDGVPILDPTFLSSDNFV
jgi:hypothetical protein